MTIDLEELAAVVRLLKDADFSEFNYTRGDTQLVVRRGDLAPQGGAAVVRPEPAQPQAAAAVRTAAPAPKAAAPVQDGPGRPVTAPLLGTFYSAPKPGEPPFVKPGDAVTPDTVLCIVEVMKLMNSVTAGVSGVVTAVHAQDGDLVEHGQPLFTIAEAG